MKYILGFENLYTISKEGQIWSVRSEKFLKQFKNGNGKYLSVNLCRGGKYKLRMVHRCVAEAYLPNPANYTQINHIDGNKYNNNVDNLEWCEGSHNMKEASRLGLLHQKGENNNASKLDWHLVHCIRNIGYRGRGDYEYLARIFEVCPQTIANIIQLKTWSE